MKVQRVERHIISKGSENFRILREYCLLSTRLYNRTLYIVRQAFTGKHENITEYKDLIRDERFISEFELSKRMRKLNEKDYLSMPKAQCSQQTIAQVYKVMKSFFASLRSYKKNPKAFLGRPRMPHYKDTYNVITFPNQSISIKNNEIWVNNKLKLKGLRTDIKDFQQIRFIPQEGCIVMEIVYFKEVDDRSNGVNSMGIDIGVNNLAAITSDNGVSMIVNGRPLKSINQFYNKENAWLSSIYDKSGVKNGGARERLLRKRRNKINDYFHKASKRIVEIAKRNNIGKCYIGHNDGWKQKVRMRERKDKQNFILIPFNIFISMLKYKLEEIGCEVVLLNESHTSKCSFLDNEPICHHEKYIGRRVKRGLFRSGDKRYINADINASLNMIRRGKGEVFEFSQSIFNPRKIDTEKKLENPKGYSVEGGCLAHAV